MHEALQEHEGIIGCPGITCNPCKLLTKMLLILAAILKLTGPGRLWFLSMA